MTTISLIVLSDGVTLISNILAAIYVSLDLLTELLIDMYRYIEIHSAH